MDQLIGKVLHDRYQIQSLLGRQTGRRTFLANDLQRGLSVVVKLLLFNPDFTWDDLKLFEREAEVLKSVDHPAIPQYLDYFEVETELGKGFALVQTYIEAQSLQDWIQSGRTFNEEDLKAIAKELLGILDYLHNRQPPVVHRDIKPSNVLLGDRSGHSSGQVYLIDFGSVQTAVHGGTRTVVGTYGYMPPEQFGGQSTPTSDLYALGATLIYLATGQHPDKLPQRNMRIQFSDRVSLSPQFVGWIEALIEPDVEQRLSTARQAINALSSRLAPNSFLPVHQPHGSRIQLKKSTPHLEIKIPARGIQASDTFLILWLVIWYGFTIPFGFAAFPSILISWVVGLMPLGMFVLPAFGATYIRFDRNAFVMEWTLLGWRYRQSQGKTSAIHKVCTNNESTSINDKPLKTVAIQAGAQDYKFGAFAPPLAEVEYDWLVQEIKDWLDLK
jgi:serine/threonine protein kinase